MGYSFTLLSYHHLKVEDHEFQRSNIAFWRLVRVEIRPMATVLWFLVFCGVEEEGMEREEMSA
jgi:hypothetical protein